MSTETLTPMQQELLNRADNIFDGLAKAVNTAGTFAMEQLPDIAYQYLLYNRVYLSLVVAFAVILLVIQQTIMIKRGIKKDAYYSSTNSYDSGDHWLAYTLVSIPTVIMCATLFLVNIKSFLLVWLAPKIFST